MQDIVNDAEKHIEQIIYDFVYRLASSATEANKELSYYPEILSQDEKFMKVVGNYTKIDTKASKKATKSLPIVT